MTDDRGWKQTRLGDVCEVTSALVDPREHDYADLFHVGGANIESDTGALTELKTARQEALISGKFYFDERAVLYSKIRPYLRKVARPGFKGLCSADIYPLAPRNGCLDRDFLYYLLLTEDFTDFAVAGSARAGMPKVNRDHLFSYGFRLPPLAEQRRIVGILDEAFAAIATAKANAEKNLQNARDVFASDLEAVIAARGEGWKPKKLEELGTTQTGSTPTTSEKGYYGGFIPFVKPADFRRNGAIDYGIDGLSEKGLEQARKVASGSVLMVCIGATIGKCGYCERDITTNQQINALTPLENIHYKFLYYQMLTRDFQRRVVSNSGQATLPIISKSKWSSLTLWVPSSHDEQRRIAARFDALSLETERLESLYRQKLAALDALKKSLLHQAFSGQLASREAG